MTVVDQKITDRYGLYNGDSCEVVKGIPSNSIDYSIFSPPFASLYTYSASSRDIGNCKDDEEFYEHYKFLVEEIYRITKPGRLVSFHCMNLPTLKSRDGFIGLKDFRGDNIKLFQDAGWIYHSEVCIWKDPVTAMQRTKALGLLHKQIMKDSAMSRQGLPDYVVTMRKPGTNPDPVDGCFNTWTGDPELEPKDEYTGDFERLNKYSINVWQRYASPVWMDIRQGRTLTKESARNEDDERHICALQLDVIERCVELWSNAGDVVFSPFMGIGSEGYVSLRCGRKFIGVELKKDYYNEAVSNIENSEKHEDDIKVIKRAQMKEERDRRKNEIKLLEVLPQERVGDEYIESGWFVKVNGSNDLIENHFAKCHVFGEFIPSNYREYLEQDVNNISSYQVANKVSFGPKDHDSQYDYGLQFLAVLFYKFIADIETNKHAIQSAKKLGLPEVFLSDSRISKIAKEYYNNKEELLGISTELRGSFKK